MSNKLLLFFLFVITYMPKYKLIREIKKFWRNKVAIWCHYFAIIFFLVFLFPKIFICGVLFYFRTYSLGNSGRVSDLHFFPKIFIYQIIVVSLQCNSKTTLL